MNSAILLNIGCNVADVMAFTPEFAVRRLGKFFDVLAYEVVDSPAEKTVVARCLPAANCCITEAAVFEVASQLEQQAIAWAYEDAIGMTGTLTGPEAHTWDGGRFSREKFITLDEAKEKNAAVALARNALRLADEKETR